MRRIDAIEASEPEGSVNVRPGDPVEAVPRDAGVRRRPGLVVAQLVGAAACVVALYATGAFYRHFTPRQLGVQFVHESELAFVAWYTLWGSLATTLLAVALVRTGLAARVLAVAERRAAHPRALVLAAAAVAFAGAAAVRRVLLAGQPVADDELAYVFQAQTLLRGRLVNPLPEEAEFFHNQFVWLTERGWFGKYPIGHPLVLALGEAAGLRSIVGPSSAVAAVALSFAVGRRWFGDARAALGAALLCVSPQFVATHATQLSQTTSALAMLLAVWTMQRALDESRLRWAVGAGAAWGFALLVRPLPGALFVLVAACAAVARRPPGASAGGAARGATAFAVRFGVAATGVIAACLILGWVNQRLTGSVLHSAYDLVAASGGDRSAGGALVGGSAWPAPNLAQAAASLGGAWIRQNLWLFGWTLSLAFVPLARVRRDAILFWGLIAAAYAYRVLVPKTVVATTGPIYVFEIVPLLALATADGAVRVASVLARAQVPRPRVHVAALVLAASIVALFAFVPRHAAALRTGALMRGRVDVALARARAPRALVFADRLVAAPWGASWAYHPPNPSPDLDDAVVFVRLPSGVGGPRRAYEFWQRRFSDRRAFVFIDAPRKVLFDELRAGAAPAADASFPDVVAEQGGWPNVAGELAIVRGGSAPPPRVAGE